MGRKWVHTKLFSTQVRTKPKGNSLNQQFRLIVCPKALCEARGGGSRMKASGGGGKHVCQSATFLTPNDGVRFPFPCMWVTLE